MQKHKIILPLILSIFLYVQICGANEQRNQEFEQELTRLKKELSFIRAGRSSDGVFPRTIKYLQRKYDFRRDSLLEEEKTFSMPIKPKRIISHSVGVSEILWAICPRSRIIAVNDAVLDPRFSIISGEIKTEQTAVFSTAQTELLIGLQPDIVFTAFYSDDMLKTKLKQTNILSFDIGYFGDIDSIKEQITLIGSIIGEENNARALVEVMDRTIESLKNQIPETDSPPRILYYADGGYVPGEATNFTSICNLIGAVNAGTELGIRSWSQIDYENLLKCDPDIIIVCEGSGLENIIKQSPVLSHAKAVKNNRVYPVAPVHLGASSQFILLTAKILARIAHNENTQ